MTRKLLASSIFAAAVSVGAAHAAATITTINGGGSSLALPTYDSEFATYSAAKPKVLFSYAGAGSGAGQNAFLNNNIGYFQPVSGTNTIGYAAGTLTYGTIVGTTVDFGASDAFLSASQVSSYNSGLATTSGPLIQLPTIGVPVSMAYNETALNPAASSSYPDGINYAGTPSAVGSFTNGLTLTDSQVCGILSGKITDWNTIDSALPVGTNITVVYRSDSSGTTFLTTQHLDAVCNAGNSSFTATGALSAPVKTFASLFTTVPANFVGASGSGGVQAALLALPGSIGYLSPDYTDIAPGSAHSPEVAGFVEPTYTPAGGGTPITPPAGTLLPVAAVVNPNATASGTAYFPNVTNTELGLNHPATGSTNPTPPNTLSSASNPTLWIPAVPQTSLGYSIVGYTTVDLSQCYLNATVSKTLIAILKDTYEKTGTYNSIITTNGFAPLEKTGAVNYVKSIEADFTSNKSGYGLDIGDTTSCGTKGR